MESLNKDIESANQLLVGASLKSVEPLTDDLVQAIALQAAELREQSAGAGRIVEKAMTLDDDLEEFGAGDGSDM